MRTLRIATAVALLLIVLSVAAGLIPWEPSPPFLERTNNVLNKPLLQLGEVTITPAFLVKAIIYLLLLATVTRWSRRLVRTHVLDRLEMEEGQRYALERMTGYVLFMVGLVMGLDLAGITLSSLALLGGAVGIGIGFGMQAIASNFVSGLVLLFERPIKVGDRVEVANLNGDVVKIGARSTWVRTNDNIVVILPNTEFMTKPVVNWTATSRQVRFSLPVGVSYRANPEQVRDVLLAVGRNHADVLSEPPPDVIFRSFGDSSLNFELRVWTITRVQTSTVLRSELYFAVFQAFRENGIEIPYPQRDLHLRTVSASLAVRAADPTAQ